MIKSLDINCDMGEGFANWVIGDDPAMMERITTANVACGFHAGDAVTMLNTVRLAKANGVEVGSHPGFPDLLGFGRRVMHITPEDAYAYIIYQTGALQAALKAHDMQLHHIKPHGAFYSVLRTDEALAEAVAEAICAISDPPVLYWPAPDNAMSRAAKRKGIRVVAEVYPDMTYAPDGALIVERKKLETNLDFAIEQVKRFASTGKVQAVDGSLVAIEAESLCVHGDGPNAPAVSDAVRKALEEVGCAIEPLRIR